MFQLIAKLARLLLWYYGKTKKRSSYVGKYGQNHRKKTME